ncbi:hypothetical protein E4T47_08572 [Aureobasidium subglaciale]|nr:hypothetical protein E4T47_08572 [Aureobasidium subglaciale]
MSTQAPTKMLLKATAALLESSEYSDLTINCGSDVYKVHKAIVCGQSEFFRLACRTRIDAKGDFKEGKTGTVDIPRSAAPDTEWDVDAEDPKCVKLMIHYLYHMDYLEVETAKIKAEPTATMLLKDCNLKDVILIQHAKMYAMGDKYDIPGLKTLAQAKFEDIIKYTCAGLVTAMTIVYTSTVDMDKGLRQMIVNKLHATNTATSLSFPEINQNVKDLFELSYALLRKQLGLAA